MAITIRDVATAAGVSPMAVSKVLHDRGANVRVGVDTAIRIRKAAEELGYQPNSLARSFRNRRTNTIGLVYERASMFEDTTGYFTSLFNGVAKAAFAEDFSLTICPKFMNAADQPIVHDGRFDGLLWCQVNLRAKIQEAIDRMPIPVVMMHAPIGSISAPASFTADNRQGISLAVNHLVELGHRRIAFVIDRFNVATAEGVERTEAFFQAMEGHGLSPVKYVWSFDARELSEWKQDPIRATGLICFSEHLGASTIFKCQELSVRVPEELSVVGFDSTPFCDTTRPRLTSIKQPIFEMSFDATQMLLNLILNGPQESRSRVYPCGFDVRESTAPPVI